MTIQQPWADADVSAPTHRPVDAPYRSSSCKVGDWVEVRSEREILATLDASGELDNLPFMPEMLRFCGRRFKVYRRAHKSCDTATGFATDAWHGVRLDGVVHLDLRCDGSAHGGCQAACLLFWKEEWLKPVTGDDPPSDHGPTAPRCSVETLLRSTKSPTATGPERYSCQATRLPAFSKPLAWWDLRQYWQDWHSGNVSAQRLARGAAFATYRTLTQAHRRGVGRPGRLLYDAFQKLRGGIPFPVRTGTLPVGKADALEELDLQPGEWVRVKSFEAILATLDTSGRNRNMFFGEEQVAYCGGIYRVHSRVERFVDESTGVLRRMKTPAVILENVICKGCYSSHRMQCPRSIYSWWRELWLERVDPGTHRNATPLQRPSSPASN